jgi:hypothetical protein
MATVATIAESEMPQQNDEAENMASGSKSVGCNEHPATLAQPEGEGESAAEITNSGDSEITESGLRATAPACLGGLL